MNSLRFRVTDIVSVRQIITFCGAALIISFLAGVVLTQSTYAALSHVGPNPASNGGYGGSDPRYVLEHTPQNAITEIKVPIYAATCPSTATTIRVTDFKHPQPGQPTGQPGIKLNGSSAAYGNTSFSVAAREFTKDPTTGWCKTTVTAELANRSVGTVAKTAMFRLQAPSGMLIGIGGNSRYSTISGRYITNNPNLVYSYNIPFATPCDISTNTRGTITLRDLDNGRHPDNFGHPVTVRVIDARTGRSIDLERRGSMGNGGTYSIRMTFEPGARYQLLITGMHANNSVDYTFPFDNIAYQIDCGWSINGRTSLRIDGGAQQYVNRVDVLPGQELRWVHTLNNSGPAATGSTNIRSQIRISGFSQGWPNGVVQSPPFAASSIMVNPMAVGGRTIPTHYTRYTPQDSEVGNMLCQQVEWDPVTNTGMRNGRGGPGGSPVCARVMHRYQLIPSVLVPADDSVADGADNEQSVTARVVNNGPTRSHTDIRWRITQLVYESGISVASSGGVSGDDACGFFATTKTCNTLDEDVRGEAYLSGHGVNYDTEGEIDNLPIGSKVCYVMSVKRNSSSSEDWRHSAPSCLTVGKAPKVQVHGGSLQVGRSFMGKHSTEGEVSGLVTRISGLPGGERTFGSWVEYGILATGQVRGVASGAGLAGEGSSFRDQSQWSGLTFTRTSPTSFGEYRYRNTEIPTISTMFPTAGAPSVSGSLTPEGLAGSGPGGRVVSSAAGTLTIRGGTLGVGKWAVLHAPNTHVVIDGNIDYTKSTLSRTADIPQLVIIARTITINHPVERVDAWLIAGDAISTCEQRGTAAWLSAANNYTHANARLAQQHCNRPLVVNGPVMTNKLYLRRTAGSNPAAPGNLGGPGEPAEVFNLRADAYLWINNHRAAGRIYQTTSLHELPPRY